MANRHASLRSWTRENSVMRVRAVSLVENEYYILVPCVRLYNHLLSIIVQHWHTAYAYIYVDVSVSKRSTVTHDAKCARQCIRSDRRRLLSTLSSVLPLRTIRGPFECRELVSLRSRTRRLSLEMQFGELFSRRHFSRNGYRPDGILSFLTGKNKRLRAYGRAQTRLRERDEREFDHITMIFFCRRAVRFEMSRAMIVRHVLPVYV